MECRTADYLRFHTKTFFVLLVRQYQKFNIVAKGSIEGTGEIRRVLHGLQLTHDSNVHMVVGRTLYIKSNYKTSSYQYASGLPGTDDKTAWLRK